MSFGSSGGMTAARMGEQGAIPALGQGVSNMQTGANFFNTLLGGNQANTLSLLQPSINQIKEQQQGTLQAASTLMPRGGGRFATLFQQPFAANRAVTDLFSGLRGQAAQALPGIGAQQARVGQEAASNLFSQDMAQKQLLNNFIQGMYQATTAPFRFTPFGGGGGGK